MLDLLQRLYRTKLTLIATIFVAVGTALVFIGHFVSTADPSWLHAVPFIEFGGTLVTAGLFGVLLYYFDQEDANQRATTRLDSSLKRAAPAIRDAVIDGFAFNSEDLARVTSTETLDKVIDNSLAIRLGDRELARDIYADLRRQVLEAPERHHDMRATVTLSPWEHGPASGAGSMFVATVRREYRVKPASSVLRFSCTSDMTEYRELLRDPTTTEVWYFEPVAGLDASAPEVFDLLQFTVDGTPRPIRQSKRSTARLFTVALDGTSPDKEVQIVYTYRVLVQKQGHLLYLDVNRPCKGLKVELWYGGCGIQHVNVLDFIASAQHTRVLHSPGAATQPNVSLSFDNWVFPKSGVVFGWGVGR